MLPGDSAADDVGVGQGGNLGIGSTVVVVSDCGGVGDVRNGGVRGVVARAPAQGVGFPASAVADLARGKGSRVGNTE